MNPDRELSLRWLDRIPPVALETTLPKDRTLLGDRAFDLSRIAQKGYSILPGSIVSAQMLSDFWQSQRWQEPLFAELLSSSLSLNVDDPSQLQAIACAIRRAILAAELPSGWVSDLAEIVSSESVNTAILHPSLSVPSRLGKGTQVRLNELLDSQISGVRPEDLALALKRVWAELFRARSLFCWQRYGIALSDIRLAVVVQPLPEAIASGSLEVRGFHADIQATPGLESISHRREVIPELYRADLQTGEIRIRRRGFLVEMSDPFSEVSIGEPERLPNAAIGAALELARQLRADLGENFKLEWVLLGSTSGMPNALTSASSIDIVQVYPLGANGMEIPLEPNHPTASAADAPTAILRGVAASGGQAIAPARTLAQLRNSGTGRSNPYILVAPNLEPDAFPLLQNAAGLVAEWGGLTSHAAIFARELGIPAVVGVVGATDRIKSGEWLHLDGDRGEVHLNAISSPVTRSSVPPASTSERLNLATQLWVNLSQPGAIDRVAALPVDGVGLIRSERMVHEVLEGQPIERWLEIDRSPQLVDRLAEALHQFTRAFAPRSVFYRTFDGGVRGRTADSVLAVRGTLSYLVDPTLFDLELAAMVRVRQAGGSNLQLLLPFVRTVEEFEFCRQRLEAVGLARSPSFQVWIALEVPSAIFLLPDYLRAGVSGIAIGSNDLTQLMLAAHRDNRAIADRFDARHPAVMRVIQQAIEVARAAGIPCSICGDAPARYPELVDALVRWGITAISVSPDAVESTARAIDRAEKRLLLDAARSVRGMG